MDKLRNLTFGEQIEILNNKSWYRLLKILSAILIVLAFSSSVYFSDTWIGLIDGVINSIFWIIVILIIRRAIAYIVFGETKKARKKELPAERKEYWQKKWQFQKKLLLISLMLLFIMYVLMLY